MELKQSQVIYDPVPHTYTLDGKQLKGITAIIKERIFPDEYANVPEATLKAAAERGTRIHQALELYDTTGITTEDCTEFMNYLGERDNHPFMHHHLATEYVVSDGREYASAIDKVYADEDGESVILADIKTTYKLNKDYVSWQLSVYAYFFALLNPGIKVKGLYAVWLRDDKHKIVEVARHSEEEVKALLYGEAVSPTANGEATAKDIQEIADIESEIVQLSADIKQMTDRLDTLKAQAGETMTARGVRKYNGLFLTITKREDSERTTFDSKAFAKADPDTYKKFTKTSVTKGGYIVKLL
jgi:hypothetical protein